MVSYLKTSLITALLLLAYSQSAWAILHQTTDDLAKLQDMVRYQVDNRTGLRDSMLPMLVATPKNHWQESRQDFSAVALKTLQEVFSDPGQLIICPECDTHRLRLDDSQALAMNNGELSVLEMAALKKDPRYGKAKSLAVIKETPQGVRLQIVDLTEGRILFAALADSSSNLDTASAWTNYSQEVARRQRQEALAYVFINLGAYPTGMLQVEFLEQWGKRNQHLTGIGISLFNPAGALGVTYHYMLPWLTRVNVSLGIYYPLQGLFSKENDKAKDEDVTTKVVGQAMVQYAVTESFGIFASGNNDQGLSLGLNLFNPLFMPFLL